MPTSQRRPSGQWERCEYRDLELQQLPQTESLGYEQSE
jgi:hypothetical protein